MIIAIGIDLAEVERIKSALENPVTGTRFRNRVYTEGEQRYCESRRAGRYQSYAARFAAKEACSKALGTGLRKGVFWRDMGVINLASGRPTLALTGGAARHLAGLTPAGREQVVRWLLSAGAEYGIEVANWNAKTREHFPAE